MNHSSNRSISIVSIASLFSYTIFALSDNPFMVERSSLMIPDLLGQISVVYDKGGFYVLKDDEFYDIKQHWMDKKIRNITREQLKAFLKNGYLCVSKVNNEYKLNAKVRGLGGGPLTAWVLYSLTKGTCYGVGAAALGAGAAVVGTGIPGVVAGAGIATITAGAGTTASVVSSAIVSGGYTAAAFETTTAVGMVGGSIAGAAAIVETASLAAFAAGMACPFCP